MSVFQWFYEYVIGPSTPSAELKEYARKTNLAIVRLEKRLAETGDQEEQKLIEEKLLIKRNNIAVFERMYPGMIAKIKVS